MAARICALGASLVMVGIMLGAFGAHGLQDLLDERGKAVYEKAVLYHFVDAIGILIAGICGRIGLISPRSMNYVASLLTLGIMVFSGSLYLLAVTQQRWLGMITPIGGTAFIVGWLLFAWKCWRFQGAS